MATASPTRTATDAQVEATAEAAEAEATRRHRRGTARPPTRPPPTSRPDPSRARAGRPHVAGVEDELRVGLLESMKQALGDAWSAPTSSPATTSGSGSPPRPGATRRPRPGTPRLHVLRLPVGHRLAAVAVRPQRGRARSTPPRRAATPPIAQGYAGGETRFQVLARVQNPERGFGAHAQGRPRRRRRRRSTRWIPVYAGANWHEREAWEMFGITFEGHPDLAHIYLPGDVRGPPAAQGLPAAGPRGEAVARHRRRRAHARRGRARRGAAEAERRPRR